MPQNNLRIPRSHHRTPPAAGDDRPGPAPRRGSRAGPRTAPRPGRRVVTSCGVVTLVAIVIAVSHGSLARVYAFVDYGSGVLALVCLTATVMWGLAATDRILGPGHRIVAQAVHRGTAAGGLGSLVLHVWVKIVQGSTTPAAAAVPFTDTAQPVLVGYGTLAAYLFVAVAVTGTVRGVFARSGRSRWWRALHMCAYGAWGLAVVHGLRAGRPTWDVVTLAYALCLVAVAAALALRLVPGRSPPRNTPGTAPHEPVRPARGAEPSRGSRTPASSRRRAKPSRRRTRLSRGRLRRKETL